MKLLVFSHACVTPINQQFYAEVEIQTGWALTMITPSRWKNQYSNQIEPQRWWQYQGQLMHLPVWGCGRIPLHCYRSLLISLLRNLQPDAIYVHNEAYALGTAQILLANRLSINQPIGFYSAQNIYKRYPPPFQQIEKFVLKHSQFAFPVSQGVEKILRLKGYQNLSQVLPLSIDQKLYYPYPEALKLANQLRAQAPEVLIGYVGRIEAVKGLKTMLLALQQIQDLPWRLIMIGSGSYEHELEAIALSLQLQDRIQRLGYISHPEVPLYLSAFDLLVLPSETQPHWKEQFGRVIIEAIACGTPVIGSDSGEIPNLIQQTGGGLIFPEGEPEVLAQQLKQLILDRSFRLQLADLGRKNVIQNYTTASLAQRFAQVIEQATLR